jgi:hypothetical protein
MLAEDGKSTSANSKDKINSFQRTVDLLDYIEPDGSSKDYGEDERSRGLCP